MTDLIERANAVSEALQDACGGTYDAQRGVKNEAVGVLNDLARALIAANELADALEHLRGAYDCSDVVDPALAAFRAATKGSAND